MNAAAFERNDDGQAIGRGAIRECTVLSAAPIGFGPEAVDEAKTYLRVECADEEALIAGLVASAAGLCEQFTGRVLIRRSFVETIPAASAWQRLRATPVAAIIGAQALGRDGSEPTLAAGAYAVDIDAGGDGWVRLTAPIEAPRLRVTYEAGMAADWGCIPEALRHGTVRLAAHLYAHRDRADGEGPPAAVTALWRPWRRLRLG